MMATNKWNRYIFSIIFIILNWNTFEISPSGVYLENYHIKTNKQYLTASIHPHSNRTKIDCNITIVEAIPGKIIISMLLKFFANKEFRTLVRWRNFDYCQFYYVVSSDNILGKIFEDAKKQNFILPCPIEPKTTYLKNFGIDTKYLPSIVPSGKLQAYVEMTQIFKGSSVKILNAVADLNYVK